jgi:Mg-chelatase subunit ChlD
MMVLDMSGSMNDDGGEPPQPVSDAKTAAAAFVRRLAEDDRVGVVSFDQEARLDRSLGSRHEEAYNTLAALAITPEAETGATNLGEGLRLATEELNSERHQKKARKIIVALTDGIANAPKEPGGELYASEQAVTAKKSDINIYTIGLGSKINRAFLESIVSVREQYFAAPNRKDLDGIYKEIGGAICEHGPAIIDVVPRTPNDL